MLAQSDKIMLRRLDLQDQAAFSLYRNDPDIARFQSWEPMTDVQEAGFLQAMAEVDPLLRPGHWTQVAVADAGTNALMGDMGLFLAEDSGEVELGITLARAHHGQGFASEAMRLAIGLVFDSTDANRVICGADTRNEASLRMIHRLGFHYTHDEPQPDGDGVDAMFALSRAEFDQK